MVALFLLWPPTSQWWHCSFCGHRHHNGGTVPSVATNITMVALFLLWPPTSQDNAGNAGVGGTVPPVATNITRRREQRWRWWHCSFCGYRYRNGGTVPSVATNITRRRKQRWRWWHCSFCGHQHHNGGTVPSVATNITMVALFLLWPPTSQWRHCSFCGHQHHNGGTVPSVATNITMAALFLLWPPTSQWRHCSFCGHQHHNGSTVPSVAADISRRRKLLGHQPHQLHTIVQARHGPVAWPAASQDGAGGARVGGAVDGGVGHGHGLRTAVVPPLQRLLAGYRRRKVRMVRRHPSTGARGGHRPAVPAGTSLRRRASLPRQSVEGCRAGLAFLPLQRVEGCGAGLAFLPLQRVEGGGGGGGGRLAVLALQ